MGNQKQKGREVMIFNNTILEMITKYPNDQDLGREYRNYCILNGDLNKYCIEYPNNFELGNHLRKTFNYG